MDVDPGAGGPGGLHAVWGRAGDDVWAVGGASTLLHFDGRVWSKLDVEPGHDFVGVGGSRESGAFAVGRKGLIARLDVAGITVESAPLASDLFAIWSGGKGLYAVGDYGKILYSAGDGIWTEQVSGTEAALFAVYGLRGHIFAAGRLGRSCAPTASRRAARRRAPTWPCPSVSATASAPRAAAARRSHVPGCEPAPASRVERALRRRAVCAADGVGCRRPAAADTDCQDGFYCDASGACKARVLQGSACDDTSCKTTGCRQCFDGLFCTDHVCCDKSPAQCGGCMQCSAPDRHLRSDPRRRGSARRPAPA